MGQHVGSPDTRLEGRSCQSVGLESQVELFRSEPQHPHTDTEKYPQQIIFRNSKILNGLKKTSQREAGRDQGLPIF